MSEQASATSLKNAVNRLLVSILQERNQFRDRDVEVAGVNAGKDAAQRANQWATGPHDPSETGSF